MTTRRLTPRRGRQGRLALLLAIVVLPALALSLLAAGCSKSPDKNVVATVGPKKVTQAEYEARLARLQESELPRDPQGALLDTGTRAGRLALLDGLVRDKLMVLKAEEMGLGADQTIVGSAQTEREYYAPTVMHTDLVEKPCSQVSEEEIQAYYKSLQEKRQFSFLICKFRDDAEKARQEIVGGKPWEEVADQYNEDPNGTRLGYKTEMGWEDGIDDAFSRAIWALKEGEISQPVETVYGYWVVRLNRVTAGRVAPLEGALKQRVTDATKARKLKAATRAFVEESRRKHDFKLDESALWIVYQGLPEGETALDPVTNKPRMGDQLKPLNIPAGDLDRFLLQVKLDGKLQSWTVGDYKQMFDKMNSLGRPKREDMLGGLRRKVMYPLVDRPLLLQEAKERGYMDDPRVTGISDQQREQMMVERLRQQVVKIDERISPEEMAAYWRAHAPEYDVPETRFGRVVVCTSQDAAQKARDEAVAGGSWADILVRWSGSRENRQNGGTYGPVAATTASPLAAPVFALRRGEWSAPIPLGQAWAVACLDSTAAPRKPELAELSGDIGQRIRAQRTQDKLAQLLAAWRGQFPVKVFENRLDRCRAWSQLTTPAAAGAPAR